jgi:Sulfotransferase domain
VILDAERPPSALYKELTMGLKIIGSGFGRTGTMSLKRALEQLAFGPCHHMEELLVHPSRFTTGSRSLRGGG